MHIQYDWNQFLLQVVCKSYSIVVILIQDMEQAHQDELGQLSREIQTLQADIKKRDFLIQTLESNASWMESQQREMLDKLRTALNEKDRTIKVCVCVCVCVFYEK